MATPEQELASKYLAEERLFDAKKELEKIAKENLTKNEEDVMKRAEECETSINIVKSELDPSWKKLNDTKKGSHVHSTIYKLEFKPVRVDFIVEAAIEKSLVFPLLSVINEVDLYPTWLPKWSTPKFQVSRAETLKRSGKTGQVGTVRIEHPLATAEFYIDILGIDDTNANKEFVISIDPLEEGDQDLVPEPVKGINRVTVGGGLLFRRCPEDRAEEAKKLKKKKLQGDDEFVLFSLSIVYANKKKFVDPGFLTKKMSGFMIKVVSGMIFSKLLSVAEEVRDGKRPDHDKAIADKQENYDFLKECVDRIG